MPLIRIESRKKPAPAGAPQPAKPAPPGRGSGGRGGTGPAVLAGALVGLLAIALLSAAVILQRRAAPAPVVVPAGSTPAAVPAGPTSPPLAALPPLNTDFPREAIVAYVNGEPYTMAHLETAVRVAKALAAISKDPAPDYGRPEMKDFQITVLRREIDGMLIRQALARSGTPLPPIDVQPVIDGFLKQYGASPEQLAAALAANGVGQAELATWFNHGRDTQFFIQTQLMTGKNPDERDQVVQAWLAQQWNQQDIKIQFYLPEGVPADATPPSPASPAP